MEAGYLSKRERERAGHVRRERERAFIENGSKVLEKLVSTCNGKPIPIRTFSLAELSNATNNFDPQLVIREKWPYNQWYKGYLEGRTISIKEAKYADEKEEMFIDLAISAKVSAHKNVLKLVGCCLETEVVILVYEFAGKGTLEDLFVADNEPLTWESRLRMARESAHAISYLHTAFSRPIIHTDIGLHNIFVDCHGVPKLTGFSHSLIIPEGETHVKDDCDEWEFPRTMRKLCPNYKETGCITEKTDVYCFGATLLEILTGERCQSRRSIYFREKVLNEFRNCDINTMVDSVILAGELRGAVVEQQIQAVRNIALRCMEEDPMQRPTMVDVSKELRRIEKSIP